jgi:hypothetical protein
VIEESVGGNLMKVGGKLDEEILIRLCFLARSREVEK